MFSADVYSNRRQRLKTDVHSGLILFLGNGESPINAPDNCYFFRQDSSFLYFWGLDLPKLAAVIDVDADTETVFGDDLSLDDVIWTGSQPSLSERCRRGGVNRSLPLTELHETIGSAIKKNRLVHFLPPYRMEQTMLIAELCSLDRRAVVGDASETLIRSVIRQRSVKSDEELAQIEAAVAVNGAMQRVAMRMATPGRYEREVVGAMEGLAYGQSGRKPPFATIFSIHGQTLHNHCHDNRMKMGDLAISDCGAESPMGYASDTTRTIPVGGRFTSRQKDIYEIVQGMQADAMAAMKPGVPFKDVHLVAARRLSSDLKTLGLMRGDVDQAIETGAYALFFPHGLGHMLGLDVHDMECLGEDYVGYTDRIQRDRRFGLNRLRLAKTLDPGFVVTVEPGIYFIPPLVQQWRAENRFADQIDYDKLESFLDFGGVRIEDDVRVTATGATVLGPPIPKTVAAVESCCST
ncbi:aminopeptidase P family protein [uncultured Desulfosarcina sp.]|uniref:aminopeptidase P family protein n=1 Tax=uncultured Desulfosarcina sp. TaxID=218289 RepID=UPI0029C893CA|nr:aminopeptidase P family protein [uncultured Desulfosarcina sp.]